MNEHIDNLFFKNKKDISEKEKEEINNLILESFSKSRFKYYDTCVYWNLLE